MCPYQIVKWRGEVLIGSEEADVGESGWLAAQIDLANDNITTILEDRNEKRAYLK